MKRLTAERMNGIKTGYWSASKKEELVQRLAEYENIGPDPAEIRKQIQQYRDMDRKLREAYGDCDGLLERTVDLLCEHAGIDIGEPIRARLLTDEDIDKWDAYREIGTVEECKELVSIVNMAEKNELAKVIDEWLKYSKIGTVEECREAREKQKPEKPIPINYKEYVNKIANAEFLKDSCICPNCKIVLRSGKYCNRCGQNLCWNEMEGMKDE